MTDEPPPDFWDEANERVAALDEAVRHMMAQLRARVGTLPAGQDWVFPVLERLSRDALNRGVDLVIWLAEGYQEKGIDRLLSPEMVFSPEAVAATIADVLYLRDLTLAYERRRRELADELLMEMRRQGFPPELEEGLLEGARQSAASDDMHLAQGSLIRRLQLAETQAVLEQLAAGYADGTVAWHQSEGLVFVEESDRALFQARMARLEEIDELLGRWTELDNQRHARLLAAYRQELDWGGE